VGKIVEEWDGYDNLSTMQRIGFMEELGEQHLWRARRAGVLTLSVGAPSGERLQARGGCAPSGDEVHHVQHVVLQVPAPHVAQQAAEDLEVVQ
jgi:hypothetical protein